MISSFETYSFRRSGLGRRLVRYLLLIVVAFALYLFVSNLVVYTVRVDSISMQPALSPGDRLFATPLALGVPLPFLPDSLTRYREPQRGDLVVFRLPGGPTRTRYQKLLEVLVRFATLGRRSLESDADGVPLPWISVKRVVGIPGDVVRVVDRVALVRVGGGSFVPEDDLITTQYSVNTRLEAGPGDGMDFLGDMEDVRLGPDQYLLLGDNRPHSADSRAWGVVQRGKISGLVVLRYWPLRRFGRP